MFSKEKNQFKNVRNPSPSNMKNSGTQFRKKILKLLIIFYLVSFFIPIEFIECVQEFVDHFYDNY